MTEWHDKWKIDKPVREQPLNMGERIMWMSYLASYVRQLEISASESAAKVLIAQYHSVNSSLASKVTSRRFYLCSCLQKGKAIAFTILNHLGILLLVNNAWNENEFIQSPALALPLSSLQTSPLSLFPGKMLLTGRVDCRTELPVSNTLLRGEGFLSPLSRTPPHAMKPDNSRFLFL